MLLLSAFAGNEVEAENWTLLASIAETLEAILNGHPHSKIEDLMPWRFHKASSANA